MNNNTMSRFILIFVIVFNTVRASADHHNCKLNNPCASGDDVQNAFDGPIPQNSVKATYDIYNSDGLVNICWNEKIILNFKSNGDMYGYIINSISLQLSSQKEVPLDNFQLPLEPYEIFDGTNTNGRILQFVTVSANNDIVTKQNVSSICRGGQTYVKHFRQSPSKKHVDIKMIKPLIANEHNSKIQGFHVNENPSMKDMPSARRLNNMGDRWTPVAETSRVYTFLTPSHRRTGYVQKSPKIKLLSQPLDGNSYSRSTTVAMNFYTPNTFPTDETMDTSADPTIQESPQDIVFPRNKPVPTIQTSETLLYTELSEATSKESSPDFGTKRFSTNKPAIIVPNSASSESTESSETTIKEPSQDFVTNKPVITIPGSAPYLYYEPSDGKIKEALLPRPIADKSIKSIISGRTNLIGNKNTPEPEPEVTRITNFPSEELPTSSDVMHFLGTSSSGETPIFMQPTPPPVEGQVIPIETTQRTYFTKVESPSSDDSVDSADATPSVLHSTPTPTYKNLILKNTRLPQYLLSTTAYDTNRPTTQIYKMPESMSPEMTQTTVTSYNFEKIPDVQNPTTFNPVAPSNRKLETSPDSDYSLENDYNDYNSQSREQPSRSDEKPNSPIRDTFYQSPQNDISLVPQEPNWADPENFYEQPLNDISGIDGRNLAPQEPNWVAPDNFYKSPLNEINRKSLAPEEPNWAVPNNFYEPPLHTHGRINGKRPRLNQESQEPSWPIRDKLYIVPLNDISGINGKNLAPQEPNWAAPADFYESQPNYNNRINGKSPRLNQEPQEPNWFSPLNGINRKSLTPQEPNRAIPDNFYEQPLNDHGRINGKSPRLNPEPQEPNWSITDKLYTAPLNDISGINRKNLALQDPNWGALDNFYELPLNDNDGINEKSPRLNQELNWSPKDKLYKPPLNDQEGMYAYSLPYLNQGPQGPNYKPIGDKSYKSPLNDDGKSYNNMESLSFNNPGNMNSVLGLFNNDFLQKVINIKLSVLGVQCDDQGNALIKLRFTIIRESGEVHSYNRDIKITMHDRSANKVKLNMPVQDHYRKILNKYSFNCAPLTPSQINPDTPIFNPKLVTYQNPQSQSPISNSAPRTSYLQYYDRNNLFQNSDKRLSPKYSPSIVKNPYSQFYINSNSYGNLQSRSFKFSSPKYEILNSNLKPYGQLSSFKSIKNPDTQFYDSDWIRSAQPSKSVIPTIKNPNPQFYRSDNSYWNPSSNIKPIFNSGFPNSGTSVYGQSQESPLLLGVFYKRGDGKIHVMDLRSSSGQLQSKIAPLDNKLRDILIPFLQQHLQQGSLQPLYVPAV